MKESYSEKAYSLEPKLYKTKITPSQPLTVMKRGDSLTLDLGSHYVGYLTFTLWYVDHFIDAPVTLRFRFAEVYDELENDSPYHGTLSASWLQDETITLDEIGIHTLPRRYAARYVRITVLHSPKTLSLSDFSFTALTSADEGCLIHARIDDPVLKALDTVSLRTLKNCMQRVFEDGPKRDRRLWLGDLRLQALTSYETYPSPALVRRCLYLFAAADKNEYGLMQSFVFDSPIFASGNWVITDYALMFAVTLSDYVKATGDTETFFELLPIAETVLESLHKTRDENGIVTTRCGDVFIDWNRTMSKRTALHGVYLYTLRKLIAALKTLHRSTSRYEARLREGIRDAITHLYNGKAFINPYDRYEYSVHAAVWMVLGGVITGADAQLCLTDALTSPESIKPFTPYMHHYTVEALIEAGLLDNARKYLEEIWGGMHARGGDTFFEVYVKDDPDFSPYGDKKINSMCHAWSCTPAYFIRRYFASEGETP